MNTQEQIQWLYRFEAVWDKANKTYWHIAWLIRIYDKFITEQCLPAISADELRWELMAERATSRLKEDK